MTKPIVRSARADVTPRATNLDPFWQAQHHVSDRVVHLWGLVGSEAERKALTALAESVPGVSRVSDEMIPASRGCLPPPVGAPSRGPSHVALR
jgi:hypothetical protein